MEHLNFLFQLDNMLQKLVEKLPDFGPSIEKTLAMEICDGITKLREDFPGREGYHLAALEIRVTLDNLSKDNYGLKKAIMKDLQRDHYDVFPVYYSNMK